MGAKRLPMRKLREILRLKYERRMGHRAIARACGVGVGTVSEYVRRARQAGLIWPLPPDLDDRTLEAQLFTTAEPNRERVPPDVARIHQELKRKRSRSGVVDNPINVGPARIVGESFFPQPRRQRRDVAGRMILDALQHIDQIGVRIDLL